MHQGANLTSSTSALKGMIGVAGGGYLRVLVTLSGFRSMPCAELSRAPAPTPVPSCNQDQAAHRQAGSILMLLWNSCSVNQYVMRL